MASELPEDSRSITSGLMSVTIGGEPEPPNRLRLSCFHDAGAEGEASIRAELGEPMELYILDCYNEALSRLPVADMPALLSCVGRGGHCIGLLDPVSNIIINAVNLLCRRRCTTKKSIRPRAAQAAGGGSSNPPGKEKKAPPTGPSWPIAFSSYKGLIAILQTYFRYLSQGQAMRYLHLARADLGIAVQLGEHQQFAPENWHTTSAPDLCCGRTQFALKVAAAVAGHPVPDDLARLAKSVIPFKDHKALAAVLQKGRALSVDDINGIIKSFQLQHYAASAAVQVNFHRRPHLTDMEIRGLLGSKQENGQQPAHFSCVFAESHIADIVVSRYNGPVSSICDLRTPCEMKQMLFNCLDLASTTISKYSSSTHVRRDLITASPSTASQCEHTRYLKMNLADSIHALYVKAVSLLPYKALQKHLRGILVAGHCYGPMDPVSNIILNAIWYDSVYPLLEMDVEIEPDILDSQSMLRMEARSLDSLVAMVRTATGLSEHNALEYLSYKQCDLSVVLQVTTKEICYKAYDRAGQAGKHPKHLELASFLKSMTCDVLQELRSLLINEET